MTAKNKRLLMTRYSLFAMTAVWLLGSFSLYAQAPKLNKYWVEFTDKNHTPYCTCRPAEFLSARALERRARAGIAVGENDLPVDPNYVRGLKIDGVQVHHTSRWLNAATVTTDEAGAAHLKNLPFVKKVEYIGRHIGPKNPPGRRSKTRKPAPDYPRPGGGRNPFGYTGKQNSLLNALPLHAAGHRGDGIWVAVMDGGFTNTDTINLFDSVALRGRLFPGWDFVERDGDVYEGAQHGTAVLSVMAGNLPGYFMGTAPEATYFLLKTEDSRGEYPVEEANWIAGAEWADSIGADIINASLGYTHFNDTTLNHRYAVLDGRTAIGSRGAAIAATKGMIICNSAGNEGDGSWHYIGVPADAPGIVAVGSVNFMGSRSTFSSFGPTPDGRIKPDLVAPGDEVVTAGNFDIQLGVSSGTSLASPILAGALAALWSASPQKTAAEILDAVFASADQAEQPDNERGYGLPDLTSAWLRLSGFSEGQNLFAYDRDAGTLQFLLPGIDVAGGDSVELYDAFGGRVDGIRPVIARHTISTLTISGLENLPAGAYQVLLRTGKNAERLSALVWR